MSSSYEIALQRIREAKQEKRDMLDLRDLELREIPPELFEIGGLRSLRLMNNRMDHLPETLAKLHQLEKLILVGNPLPEIPTLVFRLKNLKELHIKGCGLKEVPPAIAHLTQLEQLVLPGNQIREIPEALRALKQLKWIDLSGNQLRKIPFFLTEMENLRDISVYENPLETPPLEVAVNGLDAIRHYYNQLNEAGGDRLFEAKLLIVGEGGAGKTTLAKKIMNPDYLLREESRTKGIEVMNWQFQLETEYRPFRVNIWDFGGQEIYHATHQFFLTPNSLYVLVADTREDNTDFYYWLHAVEVLSNKSPLFIVLNEKYDAHKQLNESALRGQFENLKETFSTNLATNRGLDELRRDLEHEIQQLPHVGATLPKTWKKVREQLEQDPRDFISLNEYLTICKSHGIDNSDKALQLSGYLHDLGVFLHFPEGALRKTIILKPHWATDAVYRVLDEPVVQQNGGRFSKETLDEIWQKGTYSLMREELLGLMMKFELCYKLLDDQGFIAPQLLPVDQPDYEWEENENLILRYGYDFMPKGMLTRMIVRMHRYIEDPELAWKEGVILTRAGAQAEIIESYDRREIRIRVAGRERKILLGLIMDELDAIHTGFKGLEIEKRIPCTCSHCRNQPSPHFYRYEDLQRRLENNRLEIECEKSYEKVAVQALIDEVQERIPLKVATNTTSRDDFDVFLCYNRQDQEAVKQVGMDLKQAGLRPWLDIWEIQPGLPWRRELEKQIARVKAAIVCVGKSGIGPWQDLEVTAFLNELMRRGCPVIPVILPGVGTDPQLPLLLESVGWVDLRSKHPDPFPQLLFGITGNKVFISPEHRPLIPELVPADEELTEKVDLLQRMAETGKLHEALRLLRELTPAEPDIHQETLMLVRRLKQLNKREEQGLISEERGWIEYSNILNALFSLIDVLVEDRKN